MAEHIRRAYAVAVELHRCTESASIPVHSEDVARHSTQEAQSEHSFYPWPEGALFLTAPPCFSGDIGSVPGTFDDKPRMAYGRHYLCTFADCHFQPLGDADPASNREHHTGTPARSCTSCPEVRMPTSTVARHWEKRQDAPNKFSRAQHCAWTCKATKQLEQRRLESSASIFGEVNIQSIKVERGEISNVFWVDFAHHGS